MREEKESKEKQAAPFGFSQTSLRPCGRSWISHPFFSRLPDQRFPAVSFLRFLSLCPCPVDGGSLFFLTGGDGDQLLGGFGDVVGALDDLLGEELEVHRTGRRVGGRRFTTLHLQAGRTGRQELQGRTYCI